MTSDGLSFGPFRFDPEQAVLFRDGDAVPLGRRALLLLGALLARRGHVLKREELIDAAWPGEAVEESNLSVQISQLRKRIGSSWIRTVERVGYRFLAELPRSELGTAMLAPPAVAVLPFPDLGDSGSGALGDVLAEEVITALSRFRSLTVTARTLSFQFDGRATDVRRAAAALAVRYVVEGSIRRTSGCLRLGLQLIDGLSGAHLWADNLDRAPTDSVEDTDDLAGRAAAMIEAQVHLAEISRAERERPESLEAYDLYLRGRRRLLSSRQDDNAVGYPMLVKGLNLIPTGVQLLAAVAEVLHHRKAAGWPQLDGADDRAAIALARRGLDRPDLDAASLAIFGVALHTAGEEDLGTLAAERALVMNPNSPMALVCVGLDRLWRSNIDGAEKAFNRAVELSQGEPTQRFALQGMAMVNRVHGDYETMITYARRSLIVSPGISNGHWHLIIGHALLGRIDEARRHYAHYRRIAPGVTLESLHRGQIFANPADIEPLFEGMRLAGMPER